jgi:hypothetical protein
MRDLGTEGLRKEQEQETGIRELPDVNCELLRD